MTMNIIMTTMLTMMMISKSKTKTTIELESWAKKRGIIIWSNGKRVEDSERLQWR
jgi:hypothetical protein